MTKELDTYRDKLLALRSEAAASPFPREGPAGVERADYDGGVPVPERCEICGVQNPGKSSSATVIAPTARPLGNGAGSAPRTALAGCMLTPLGCPAQAARSRNRIPERAATAMASNTYQAYLLRMALVAAGHIPAPCLPDGNPVFIPPGGAQRAGGAIVGHPP